jgi:hypothetical protein
MTSNTLPISDTSTPWSINWQSRLNEATIFFLKSHISSCLYKLVDTGKKVNYEEVFLAIGKLPESIHVPEWEKNWTLHAKNIEEIKTKIKRKKFFKKTIEETIQQWIFPTDQGSISWLTGNFSHTIAQLIKNCTL